MNVRYRSSCKHSHLLSVELFPAIAAKIQSCMEANKTPTKMPRSQADDLDPSKRARTHGSTPSTDTSAGAASLNLAS